MRRAYDLPPVPPERTALFDQQAADALAARFGRQARCVKLIGEASARIEGRPPTEEDLRVGEAICAKAYTAYPTLPEPQAPRLTAGDINAMLATYARTFALLEDLDTLRPGQRGDALLQITRGLRLLAESPEAVISRPALTHLRERAKRLGAPV